jgi:hypothetical protein
VTRALLLACVCACNEFYGLHDTQIQSDARTFACPAIGQAPRFDRALHQVVFRDCQGYNIRGTRAAAVCAGVVDGMVGRRIEVGPIDGDLVHAAGLPAQTLPSFMRAPRLGLGGERIYVPHDQTITTYRRQPDDAWRLETDLMGYFTMSTTADDGGKDRFLAVNSAGQLVELVVGDPPTTPQVMPRDLGMPMFGAGLTLDGLRLVFIGTDQKMFFTDRMQIADAFRTPAPIDVPQEFDPFMLDDCSRIYLNDVGSVFYVEQD